MGEHKRRPAGGILPPTYDQIMQGCLPLLVADYEDALRHGEGTGLDDLAGLITEKVRAVLLPVGLLETETGVYSRAAMVADFERGEAEGTRELAAKLKAWAPPEPGFFPVVYVVHDVIGIVPVRLSKVGGVVFR